MEFIWRILNPVTHQKLSKILGAMLFSLLRLAIWKAVVAEWELSLNGCKRIHHNHERLIIRKLLHVASRQIKSISIKCTPCDQGITDKTDPQRNRSNAHLVGI
jgi:hypothetical protein